MVSSISRRLVLPVSLLFGILAVMFAVQYQAMIVPNPEDRPILLFDGVCNLCDGFVNFVIDHDPNMVVRFAALQSVAGKEILDRVDKLNECQGALCRFADTLESLVLVVDNKYYTHSEAALRTLTYLEKPWSYVSMLLGLPRGLRDWGYKRVAEWRYALFGHADVCRKPSPTLQSRFVLPVSQQDAGTPFGPRQDRSAGPPKWGPVP